MGIDRQMSMRAKTKDALGRIQTLEETIPQIVQGVNQAFGEMNAGLSAAQERLEAVVKMLGTEQVEATIQETRVARAAAQAEAQKDAVAEAVKGGKLLAVDKIGEQSLVVGTEFDKENKAVGSGRVQLPFAGIKPEFRDQLLGKGTGASFDLPEGKFVVNEIYDPAPEAPAPTEAPAPCDGDCKGCTANGADCGGSSTPAEVTPTEKA